MDFKILRFVVVWDEFNFLKMSKLMGWLEVSAWRQISEFSGEVMRRVVRNESPICFLVLVVGSIDLCI